MRFSRTWSSSTRSPCTGGIDPTVTKSAASRPSGDPLRGLGEVEPVEARGPVAAGGVGEQVQDQAVHPGRRRPDPADELLDDLRLELAVGRGVVEQLGPAVDGGQRVAQVVGDHAGERRAAPGAGRARGWRRGSAARRGRGRARRRAAAVPPTPTAPVPPARPRWKATWALRTVSPANARRLGRRPSGSRCPSAYMSGSSSSESARRSDGSKPSATDAAGLHHQDLAGVVDDGEPFGHRRDDGVEHAGLVDRLPLGRRQLAGEQLALVAAGGEEQAGDQQHDAGRTGRAGSRSPRSRAPRTGRRRRGSAARPCAESERVEDAEQGGEPQPDPDRGDQEREGHRQALQGEPQGVDACRDRRRRGDLDPLGAAVGDAAACAAGW